MLEFLVIFWILFALVENLFYIWQDEVLTTSNGDTNALVIAVSGNTVPDHNRKKYSIYFVLTKNSLELS